MVEYVNTNLLVEEARLIIGVTPIKDDDYFYKLLVALVFILIRINNS